MLMLRREKKIKWKDKIETVIETTPLGLDSKPLHSKIEQEFPKHEHPANHR